VPTDSINVATLLSAALGEHQAGRLAAAEIAYRRILAIAPDHAKTLHYLGVLSHQLGRSEAAVELIERAIGSDDSVPEFHYNAGVALEALNRLDAAATHYRNAIALKPDYARAHLSLGNALLGQNKLDEAEAACRRAVALAPGWPDAPFNLAVMSMRRERFDEAIAQFLAVVRLQPDRAAAHSHLRAIYFTLGNLERAAHHGRQSLALEPRNHQHAVTLGLICLAQGDSTQALELALHALELEESPQARYLFTRAACHATVDNARFRELLRRSLAESWSRPGHLMRAAVKLIKMNSAVRAAIARQSAAMPQRLSLADLCGAGGLAEIANDRLLGELLRTAPICDGELERLFTAMRHGVLDLATDDGAPAVTDGALRFFCALAQQCFANEYIYAVTVEEQDRVAQLAARLSAAVTGANDALPLWIAAVGCYLPLNALESAEMLLNRAWPDPVAAVVRQQIAEPKAQRDLRASRPVLTAIENGTSITVKQQYEENPFPRWNAVAPMGPPVSFDAYMKAEFRDSPYRPLGKDLIDILIAGCGTGQHAIETSQRFVGADVLAVDLSTASLGYALYKTRELGLTNIHYAVADILKLDTLGRSFDLIEASGVLHHLADPFAGWRVLLSILRPGGIMNVGLYSELARDFVVGARAFIAERGYPATADGIRRFRQEIVERSDDLLLMAATEPAEFFNMSECRDFLFHAQEHRMTLPQIAAFIDEAKVTFLGFDADAALLRQYAARFPADKRKTDLASWHKFEMENPRAFAGMYQFWIQKP
jgi:tetratricopeptide (TPR) repeat protein/SAM-dependent methyltransferase